MITREEAINTCLEIIDAGILAEDIESSLQDIVSCLEAEMIGRHEWGVEDDKLGVLYTAKRVDLITDEDMKEFDRIHRKLTFIPSVDERIIIETAVCDKIEESTGMEVEAHDIEDWFRRL